MVSDLVFLSSSPLLSLFFPNPVVVSCSDLIADDVHVSTRCGHCKSLAPHWEQAAKESRGLVKFGMVDCTSEQSLASEWGIKG